MRGPRTAPETLTTSLPRGGDQLDGVGRCSRSSGEALVDLRELDFDAAEAVVHAAHVGPQLGDFGSDRGVLAAQTGDLDAEGHGRGEDGADDPLGVPGRHAPKI